MSRSRRAFTLIELLVVVAIIALLLAILLPALARAKDNAKTVACCVNLRQLNVAAQMYASENEGFMLPARTASGSAQSFNWDGIDVLGLEFGVQRGGGISGTSSQLLAFQKLQKVLHCPAAQPWSGDSSVPPDYTWNEHMGDGGKPPAQFPFRKVISLRPTTLVAMDLHDDKGSNDFWFDTVKKATQFQTDPTHGYTPMAGTRHRNNKMTNMLFIDGSILTVDPIVLAGPKPYANPSPYEWVVNPNKAQDRAFPYNTK
jgi:prepilin-type N-terminal cleavage/methylation domain-containing protein